MISDIIGGYEKITLKKVNENYKKNMTLLAQEVKEKIKLKAIFI